MGKSMSLLSNSSISSTRAVPAAEGRAERAEPDVAADIDRAGAFTACSRFDVSQVRLLQAADRVVLVKAVAQDRLAADRPPQHPAEPEFSRQRCKPGMISRRLAPGDKQRAAQVKGGID